MSLMTWKIKELSEAGIVSEYSAYNATNFKDMNLNLEYLCLNAMESALIPKNPNEAII
jgi:hypothetical protein